MIIKGKGVMDGAETLGEAAKNLRAYADHLAELERQGYSLAGQVEGDTGYLFIGSVPVVVQANVGRVQNLLATALKVCGYWVRCIGRDVREEATSPEDEHHPERIPLLGGALLFRLTEDGERCRLDYTTIQEGLALMVQGGPGIPPRHGEAFLAHGGDNETADVFLQLCLLGKIEYSR